jgi:predicted ATPase/DNA-binding SARP family transcriptional activator
MAETPLQIQLLGAFSMQVRTAPSMRISKQGHELIARMVVAGEGGVDRIELAQGLWPDAQTDRAQFYLRRCLTQVRSALASERGRLRQIDDRRMTLDLHQCECDLISFDEIYRETAYPRLVEAESHYRGDLLVGHRSDWVQSLRITFRGRYLSVLCRIATHFEDLGELDLAEEWLAKATRVDPLREETCRQTMRLLGRRGDFAAIAEAFRALRASLRQGIGLPPGHETLELYRRLLADARVVATARRDSEESPMRSLIGLPSSTSPFMGREGEKVALSRMILENRLITVTGLGGVGKSRLVTFVAKDLSAEFPAGIAYADLSNCQTASELDDRISISLGSSDAQNVTNRLVALTDRALLVLDGAEHLATECAKSVESLLNRSGKLHVVCSSQIALGASDECVYPLKPFKLPPKESASHAESLASDAVAFFITCAHRASPGLQFGRNNLDQVVELCRSLDGIPLALELAAVRLRNMPLAEIVANLDDRFSLLDHSDRSSDRHRSLRGVLDWSFSLLSAEERNLFVCLSIFPVSWKLDAARTICSDEPVSRQRIVIGLVRLVEHSLVGYDPETGEYRMLETVRSYTIEKLTEDLTAFRTLQRRHANFFLDNVATSISKDFDRTGFFGLEPDFTASMNYFLAQEDPALRLGALKLVNRLFRFWYQSETLSVGIQTTLRVIEAFGEDQNEALAEALFRAAGAAHAIFNMNLANTLFARAEAMADALGLDIWSMESLLGRGEIAANEGRLEEAERLLAVSLDRFRQSKDTFGEARSLGMLGYVKRGQNDLDAARSFTESALAINVATANDEQKLWCMGSLAAIHLAANRPEKAETILIETLAHQRKARNKPGQDWNQTSLASAQISLGKFDLAETNLLEVLSSQGQNDNDLHRAWPTIELGELYRQTGRLQEARTLLEEGLRLGRESGSTTLEARALLKLCRVEKDANEKIPYRAFRIALLELLSKIQAPQILNELVEVDSDLSSFD